MLAWLDVDREQAGKKYEEIRFRLIKIFSHRGCPISDELADEAIDRVCCKVHDIADTYIGDPALYFYGVAQNVYKEYIKRKPIPIINPPPDPPEEKELRFNCLEKCLAHFAPDESQLIVNYYQQEKKAKINNRKTIAEDMGVTVNALRMRICRLKADLQQCLIDCFKRARSE